MSVEQGVARHYANDGLERAILEALIASGKDPDHLLPTDLSPVDEFHIGGREATADFAEHLGFPRGARLLDVGSGLGGPSRYFAGEHGCRVTGVDLTEDHVRVAEALSRRVGLDAATDYRQGSALALPFAPAAFDGAYMLHVGMNIEDKAALFEGVRRVLKPGAAFGVYDVMRAGGGDLVYPVPWAATAATSFLADAATYRRLLEAAGFTVGHERDRRAFGIAFFRRARRNAGAHGLPPLGPHVAMGADAPTKIANMVANLEAGRVAPVEMIARVV